MKRALALVIAVVVLAGGAWLAWHFFLAEPQPGLPVAFARDVWGDVSSTLGRKWSSVEAGATLTGGEQMKTADASRAVLILRGAGRLVVSQETHVSFEPPVTDEDGRVTALRVRLRSGSIRAEAAADASVQLEVMVGDRVVWVEPGGKLLAQVGPAPDRVLVSFLDAAGFLVEPSGEQRRIPANSGIQVSANQPNPEPVPLPEAPTLPRGLDDERRVFTGLEGAAAVARFDFTKVDARIRLIIARDPELTDVVVDRLGTGMLESPALSAGTYYWAVATVGESGLTGPFSAARPLEVVSGEPPAQVDESPSTPVVMRPGVSGSVFYTQGVPDVGIDWPGYSGERNFHFRLSRDRRHRRSVTNRRLGESRYTARGLAPGRYYWTVRTADKTTFRGNFLVRKVTGAVPRKVTRVNAVSEQYESARIVFQREAPAIEFRWKRDARASGGYRLRVSRRSSFEPTTVSRTTASDHNLLKPGTLSEGRWYWRVERLLKDGSVFYPGRVRRLRIQFDNDVPTLELTTPAQGQLVSSKRVRVAGLAPRDLAVWINGRRIELDSQGRFDVTTAISPARPRVVIRTRRGHRTAFYVRTLRYAPSSAADDQRSAQAD